jgi:hypothetical protein
MSEEKSKLWGIIIQAFAMIVVAVIGAIVGPIVTKCFTGEGCGNNEPKSIAIETMPQNVFVYAGNNSPDGGWGAFSLIYDEKQLPNYKMEYFLPDDKYGYAGLVFKFVDGENLSAYQAIELTVVFGAGSDEIDLFIKDISYNSSSIRITGSGTDEMVLRYDLKNFHDINFNAVKEVGVFADNNFIKGSHQVLVKNVRFVK